jgi:hypothetical protein
MDSIGRRTEKLREMTGYCSAESSARSLKDSKYLKLLD